MNRICDIPSNSGHAGHVTLPARKRLNHRGPLSIDVSSAWYFITICADGHAPWNADEVKIGRAVAPRPPEGNAGRAVAPRPPSPTTSLETIAPLILREARENHNRGIWWLALFLVMPDHLHFIVNIGGRGATALPRVIANFKHLLSARYGLRFQRDFFDTRLRDDAHFAEEYDYILGNPVRKGLCAAPADWPYSIAFSRADGGVIDAALPREMDIVFRQAAKAGESLASEFCVAEDKILHAIRRQSDGAVLATAVLI